VWDEAAWCSTPVSCGGAGAHPEAAVADVRVWQGVLTLPTYQEGPPNPQSALRPCILELDLGHTQEGRALIESALLLPDRNLAHHFGRVALRAIAGKR
jgi:hypothetical protein